MSSTVMVLLALIVLCAIAFDSSNGMNDISGILAAPLATGSIRPAAARIVVLSGVICGPFVAQAVVARAYGSGIVRLPGGPQRLAPALLVLLLGLVGATLWNLLARWRGWPTSSSHALVGALIGAAIIANPHWSAVQWGWSETLKTGRLQHVMKVFAALFFSPLAGAAAGWIACRALHRALRRAHVCVMSGLHALQVLTLWVQGLSYGMNDAQKTMGVLGAAFLVISPHGLAAYAHRGVMGVPIWIKLLSVSSISFGACIGSVNIFKKLGSGVFHIHVTEALAAQLSSAAVVLGAASMGGPVSSTQVLASAIVGGGSATRRRAVRWATVAAILKSWFITIPGAAAMSAVLMVIAQHLIK